MKPYKDMFVQSLKAAVIGLGVGEKHIASYESHPRCKVVALCDRDEHKLHEVGRKYPGCRLTTHARDVLEDPVIDVVSIASYDTYHCEQVLAAIQAGKHIFVEKPLCLYDEEFEKIDTALVANPEICLSSNFVLRRAPQFLQLKQRIQNGRMGRLFYLEGDYNYGRLHKITEGWRGQIPFYSVSHGGAIHLIDLILWLSRSKMIEVIAEGNRIATTGTEFRYPDMVTILIKFEDGMTGKISANFGCVCPHHHRLAVYGTKSTFVDDYPGSFFYDSRDPNRLPENLHLTYDQKFKGDVQRAFIAHILDGEPIEVSMYDVMNAMAVSLAVERSLKSRCWEVIRDVRVTKLSKI